MYDYDTLAARFREMAFLNRGLKIILVDERITDADGNPRTEVFQAMGGIVDFVKFLNDGKETLNKPIYFEPRMPTAPWRWPCSGPAPIPRIPSWPRQQHQHP